MDVADRTVTLGELSLELRPPTDLASAWDCLFLGSGSDTRGGAMALALCWPEGGKARPKTKLSGCNFNAGHFGGQVFAELSAKYGAIDVITAGRAAMRLISSVCTTEVAATEGFSKPIPAPGPSPSSGSSAPGDVTPAG